MPGANTDDPGALQTAIERGFGALFVRTSATGTALSIPPLGCSGRPQSPGQLQSHLRPQERDPVWFSGPWYRERHDLKSQLEARTHER